MADTEKDLLEALRATAQIYQQRARALDGRVSREPDDKVLSAGHTMGEGCFIEPWAERKARRAAEAAAAVAKAKPQHVRRVTVPRISPRQQAKAQGKSPYFSEQKCPRGHASARAVSTGRCLKCQAEDQAKLRARVSLNRNAPQSKQTN